MWVYISFLEDNNQIDKGDNRSVDVYILKMKIIFKNRVIFRKY